MSTAKENGSWNLSGPLTLETAGELLKASEDWLAAAKPEGLLVDLQGVTEVDSAAVALLLEWQREAVRRGSRLRIHSAPDRLRAIARISSLEEILNFE